MPRGVLARLGKRIHVQPVARCRVRSVRRWLSPAAVVRVAMTLVIVLCSSPARLPVPQP